MVLRIFKMIGTSSAEAPPGPHWGAYSAPPDPLVGLKDAASKGERREGEGKRRKGKKKRMGRTLPFAHSWVLPFSGVSQNRN